MSGRSRAGEGNGNFNAFDSLGDAILVFGLPKAHEGR
jgi:hypothetical protein